jgi:hypothetical protein
MSTSTADSPRPDIREANGYILKVGRQDPRLPLTTYLLEEIWPDGEFEETRNYLTLIGRGVSLATACRVAASYLTAATDDKDNYYHAYLVYRGDRPLALVSGFSWDWSIKYE